MAALNPDAGEIGPGMLAQLVAEARQLVGEPKPPPEKLRCPKCSQLLQYHEHVKTGLRSAVHCPDCGYQMPEDELQQRIAEAMQIWKQQ